MKRLKSMRMTVRILGIGACGLGLTVGLVFGQKKPSAPDFVFPLQVEARVEYEGEIVGAASLAGDLAIFGTRSGRVYALDPAQKKIAWTYDTGAALSAVWTIGPETVVALEDDGRIFSLTRSGEWRWGQNPADRLTGDPALFEEKIVLIAGGEALSVINPADGTEAWRYRFDKKIIAAAVLGGRRFAVATADRELVILLASGQAARAISLDADVVGPLLADGDLLFISLSNGTFRCLETRSMSWRWRVKTGETIAAAPLADRDRIYFVTSNNILFCLKKSSGDVAWWKSVDRRAAFSPALGGATVFLASRSPRLVAFQNSTGQQTGMFDAGDFLRSRPVCVGQYVLVHIFDPATSKGTCLILKGQPPKDAGAGKKRIQGGRP